MNIPKKLWHIWIGDKPAPLKWMESWKQYHPDWEYTLIDNEYLKNHSFHNQHLIDQYINHNPQKASLAGAADLIKYEILYNHGGFIPEADSLCLNNTNQLWIEPADTCYTVYENEILRPGFVSPIFAANPGNTFLKTIIDDLHNLTILHLWQKAVYMTTGNEYLSRMIKTHNPQDLKIFPSHYFIPSHYSTPNDYYNGQDTIYCKQFWGSTKNNYHEGV
jgi:mannosyltransferase OCH1-like enzyme